jgi:hypothetical protein
MSQFCGLLEHRSSPWLPEIGLLAKNRRFAGVNLAYTFSLLIWSPQHPDYRYTWREPTPDLDGVLGSTLADLA